MPTVMLHSSTIDVSGLKGLFEKIAPELQYAAWPDLDPADVDVAICWNPEHGVLAKLPNLKMVSGMAAGVDNILADPTLPDVPVCRVLDPNLGQGMAEYVLWGVLYYHRNLDAIINGRTQREWKVPKQKAAADTRVGVMGTGALGGHVARQLAQLGFTVSGWSRSGGQTEGVTMYAAEEGLPAFLAELDVCVCLLPLTPQTTRILSKRTFAMMKKGAAIINCGRGPHVDQVELLAAIQEGQLRGAVLDVFDVEPLPDDSPIWQEPRIVITPHMASSARWPVLVQQVADNVRRMRAGEPMHNVIDRARGY